MVGGLSPSDAENTMFLVATEHHRFHTSNEFLIIVGWAIRPTRMSVRTCTYRSTLRQHDQKSIILRLYIHYIIHIPTITLTLLAYVTKKI